MRWPSMANGVEHCPDIHAPPAGMDGDAPPREPRRSRLLVCGMRLANGRVTRVRIRNISSGGMGGHCDIAIEPWQRVELMLPGLGTVVGRIAWVRNGSFGVEFDTPVDPGEVAAAPGMAQASYVVPGRFQPATDFRRPGLKGR